MASLVWGVILKGLNVVYKALKEFPIQFIQQIMLLEAVQISNGQEQVIIEMFCTNTTAFLFVISLNITTDT
jgi:hypothetical protein